MIRNGLRIIHGKNGFIEMSRDFAIKASYYGTQEYEKLQSARCDYPNYTVVRKTIKKNSAKESFKGLTYRYMELYMDRYNAPKEIRKDYEELRFQAKCHSIRYQVIKRWFLEKFPEIKNWGKVKKELDAAAAA